MQVARKVVINTVYTFFGSLIVMGLTVYFTVLCARYFGAEGYGLYSFSLSLILLLSIFGKSGLELISIREVAKDRRQARKYLSNVLTLKVFIAIFLLCLTFIYLFVSGRSMDRQLIVSLFVISSFFIMFSEGYRWAFQAFQIMEYEVLLKILQSLMLLTALLLVIALRGDILMFAAAYLVVMVIMAFVCYFLTVWKVSGFGFEFDYGFMKELILNALPLGLMYLFSAIYLNIDNVLISTIKGDVQTGLYSAAYKLMAYLRILFSYYFWVVFPAFSYFAKTSAGDKFKKLLGESFNLVLIFTLPIAAGTSLLGGRIISMFFGHSFLNSTGALIILIWVLPVSMAGGIFLHALISVGKQTICSFAVFLGLLVNLAVNLSLIPKLGFFGAVYAIIATELIITLLLAYYVRKELKFTPDLLSSLRILFSVAVMTSVTYLLRGAAFYWVVPASAVTYVALLLLTRAVTYKDIILVKESMLAKEPLVDTVEYEQV